MFRLEEKTRTLHKDREGCGTRKFNTPQSLAHPPLKKAQTIEGRVGSSPACCHSERSEESLCGFAYSKDRDREILRFAQNDTQGRGRHSAGEAGFNRL
jgi:hypothetical protein